MSEALAMGYFFADSTTSVNNIPSTHAAILHIYWLDSALTQRISLHVEASAHQWKLISLHTASSDKFQLFPWHKWFSSGANVCLLMCRWVSPAPCCMHPRANCMYASRGLHPGSSPSLLNIHRKLVTSWYGRDSSVGRASDWRSGGPQFDPGSRHFILLHSLRVKKSDTSNSPTCLHWWYGIVVRIKSHVTVIPAVMVCELLHQQTLYFVHLNLPAWQRVRVVKKMDSKSIGLCPRGFESCRCRLSSIIKFTERSGISHE